VGVLRGSLLRPYALRRAHRCGLLVGYTASGYCALGVAGCIISNFGKSELATVASLKQWECYKCQNMHSGQVPIVSTLPPNSPITPLSRDDDDDDNDAPIELVHPSLPDHMALDSRAVETSPAAAGRTAAKEAAPGRATPEKCPETSTTAADATKALGKQAPSERVL
jgi:hypothetical protein